MISKTKEREQAIALRKQGLSYTEILVQVPVSKSSLSLWLHSVGLARHHVHRLTEKKRASLKRGWETWHQVRVERTKKLIDTARSEINHISKRELWLLGTMLYWGEGTKQKPHNISQGVSFNNSDPLMIGLFLRWLEDALKIDKEQIAFELYIHQSSKDRVPLVIEYWRKIVKNTKDHIPTYFKKDKIRTLRKNIGENYYGVLRIKVRRSTDLNRKIAGWVQGVCINCRVV